MRIPARKNISRPNIEDPLPFYYMPIVKIPYLKRLQIAIDLMGHKRFERILEIGYGSGIFLPELSQRTGLLCAIDTHQNIAMVRNMLRRESIKAKLYVGTIHNLPFRDNMFDCVVSISVLEHITDLNRAIREICRTTREEGTAIIGFPVKNWLTHFLLSLIGFDDKKIHPSSHMDILREVENIFHIEKIQRYPAFLPNCFSLYIVVRCQKIK